MNLTEILDRHTVPTTHLENALTRVIYFRTALNMIRGAGTLREAISLATEAVQGEPDDQTTRYCDLLVHTGADHG